MNPEPQREEALFQAASQLTDPARAAFLESACQGDNALRKRLDDLLASEDAHDSFLEPNKLQPGSPPLKTMKLALADAPDEAIGQKIGRYKILERVGEGGCGVVYVAEQTEPVRRRVALKVIKLGMDTKAVVARFEAERQALAMMDHPNIAKVLDAGTTDTGRPYFIMELVRGIRVTDYCDQANLSTQQRLDLFISVCHAIQHAHQKGIIHRDIKPSNILVTLHDGVPVPKVIDFGIAKATEGRLSDATVYTQLHQFIGTPAYMSPEQAEMSGLDIDTRCDIYSLGVLLYELLAGSTPFDGTELMSMGIDAMRKTIREQEPSRPSTRLASLPGEERTTTAKRRSTEAPKLIHLLEGDLDWIIMKCLEKDRTRRYDTANGLAMDIQRYLNNEPVVARAPSFLYRAQKFYRRNKAAMVVVNGFALILVIATGVSAYFAVALKAQRDIATEALSKAERETAIAETINRFLNRDILGAANARAQNNKDITLREILDRTAEKLETTDFKFPQVESEIRLTLGKTYNSLAEYDKAAVQLDKGLELLRETVGEKQAQTANTLMAIANNFGGQANFRLAAQYASKAKDVLLQEGNPTDPLLLDASMTSLVSSFRLAVIKRDEAVVQMNELIATADKTYPNNNRLKMSLYQVMSWLLVDRGCYEEAGIYQERVRKLKEESNLPFGVRDYFNEAWLFRIDGNTAEWKTSLRRCQELTEKLFEPDDPGYLAFGYDAKGQLLMLEGKLDAAREFYTSAYQQVTNNAEISDTRIMLVGGYMEFLNYVGQTGEAIQMLEDEIAAVKAAHLPSSVEELYLAMNANYLAACYEQQGEYTRALEVLKSAYPILPGNWVDKGFLMLRLGKAQEFEQHRTEMTRHFKTWDDGYVAGVILLAYMAAPIQPNSPDEHILNQWMNHARRELDKAGPALRPEFHFKLGLAHFRLGEFDEARSLLDLALQGTPDTQALSRLVLARIAKESSDPQAAADQLAKAELLRTKWVMFDAETIAPTVSGLLLFDVLHEEFSHSTPLAKASPVTNPNRSQP